MKDFLDFLIKSIVDSPSAVRIEEGTDAYGQAALTIHVAPADMGKVIGKGGAIIRAVRTLTKILAARENRYVNVLLVEE